MLFDTHAHLNFRDYDKDRERVIKNSLEGGVFMINVGTDIEESERVIEIADGYKEGVYAAVGLHPLYIDKENFLSSFASYEEMVKHEKVVAVGETGLDYKYVADDKEEKIKQKDVFEKHIELAEKFGLPLILHCRKAHQDMINILKSKGQSSISGVIHCFTGGEKELEEYLKMGFYIGLNGIIFKFNIEKVIKKAPLERILLETDCPFLTPLPEKGRNEPLFIKHTAEEVARIKGVSVEEAVRITTQNAKKLFNV